MDVKMVIAVRAVVEHDYGYSAAAFRQKQTGENWRALTDAMYALQALGNSDAESLCDGLRQVAVSSWTTRLSSIQQGKVS